MMQPYAWLAANGVLSVDDRSWPTSHRGLLAAQASKGFHQAYYDWLARNTNVALPPPGAMEVGGVVGVARLTACLDRAAADRAPAMDLRRSHFGQQGYYGFVLESPKPVPFLPYWGNVKLFEIPDELIPS